MKTSLKILTGLLLAAAVACGGSDNNPEALKKKPTVSVNPSTVSLNGGDTQQFTATVADSKDGSVRWSVQEGDAGGTITAEGLYTAPKAGGTYHVVATPYTDASVNGVATVTVHPLVVAVSPGTASTSTAGTLQFFASVSGTDNTAVTWSVQESAGGSISQTGVYTAPTTAGTYHVVATSQADGKTAGTAEVTVGAVQVAVSPSSATIGTAGAQAFTATVTGTSNTAVTWSVQEANGGAINSAGYYTAPVTGGTFHIVATSVADPSKQAVATLTVQDVSVAVSPASAELDQGATAAFTATVAGSSNAAVMWSVQEANGGQVSTTGVYTAPAAAGTYHLVATSVADPSKSQSVAITVHPVAISVSPAATGALDQGATRGFTATVTGTVNHQVTWSVAEANGGTVDALGTYTAPKAAGTFTVVATSAADATQSASATVDVNAVTVAISPKTTTLQAGQVKQFTATVTGTVDTSVSWTVKETNGGTIDASGQYVAPSTIGTYHVIVTSNWDPTQSASSTISIKAAASLNYTNPTSTGWRLVKNSASTSTHLVLDLVGPSGATAKGVALTLGTDAQSAVWSKVGSTDTELVTNLAFAVSGPPALLKGVAKNSTLTAGVFQKGGAAVDASIPVASVALDFVSSGQVSGTSVPVSVVKAEALDGSGALAPIQVAVGTLKAK